MSELIISIGIGYLLLALIIRFALDIKPVEAVDEVPSGSVVICACNEEKRLQACLESLENQTVESHRLEIILVNDASEDRTGQMMDEFAERSRLTVQVLHLPPPDAGEQNGKWRPLKEGIAKASNPALLLTDADAVLPPTWAKKHLAALTVYQISVGGMSSIEDGNVWHGIQGLDWLFLQSVGSAFANLGRPQSAFGKNMALRRAAYDEAGGLEETGFSLTEDLALFRAILGKGVKACFTLDAETVVSAPAVDSWGQFLQQRKRWFTGFHLLGALGKLTLLSAGIRNILLLLGLFVAAPVAIWIWAATAAANFLILYRVTGGLGCVDCIRYFLLWEIFFTISTPLLAVIFLFNRNVTWKGRRHAAAARPVETR
jgi:cellulose synthase/poly-beta-1,6-N-acetylglucosamine synthase-like glycosyltransferase